MQERERKRERERNGSVTDSLFDSPPGNPCNSLVAFGLRRSHICRIVSSLLGALRVSRRKIVLKLLRGCLWAEMHDRRMNASRPAGPSRELAHGQHRLPGVAAEACSSGTGSLPSLPVRLHTSSLPFHLSSALENVSDVLHTLRVFPVQTDGCHVPDGFRNGTESAARVSSPRQRLRLQLYPRSIQGYTLKRNMQCPRWQLADWCRLPSSNFSNV